MYLNNWTISLKFPHQLSGAHYPHNIATILAFSSMLALSISIATITITVYRRHNKGVRGCMFAQVIILVAMAPFLLAGMCAVH